MRTFSAADELSPEGGLDRARRTALLRTAVLLVGDRATAEDVIQDCVERFDSKPRPHVLDPARYLHRMVVNECASVMRRRSREVVTDRLPAGPPHIDAHLVELHDALRSLTPRRRTAIVLRYFDDLPVKEIAELMGTRPSTVSSLIHRALSDLKEVLP